ncbi:hypothetical protein [Candidatus Enterococcus ferrettii]|uniref:Uncharacterized protein n=1 Tax=Candidatus Enterococcus ferrettii TaxID=2815324 RepID=A0ABV0ER04_9ENTE|nr:hypothetical protein [Enterococcus sp. 665A]MBO1339618.1 hypothetical protein [Enterococcus sp. 665A]
MNRVVKLVSIFRNGAGKSQTWSLSNPDTTKTPSQIKGLLGELKKPSLLSSHKLLSYSIQKLTLKPPDINTYCLSHLRK